MKRTHSAVLVATALLIGAGRGSGQEQRTRLLTDHADWFPDGSVVVSSNLTGSWQIWRVDPEGHFQRLTHNPGQDDWPTVSPDGRRVAYASYRDGQNDVWVVNVETLEEVNVTDHPADDIHPTWSPDGSTLLFNSDRDDPGRYQLHTVRLATGETQRLTEPGTTRTAASFSPDGSRIAYVVWPDEENGQPDVWVMNLDGTDARNLSDHPGFDGWPSWSPDGERIAFASNRGGWFQIWEVDAAGGPPRHLVRSPYNDRRPFYSPDGTRLSFDREAQEARNVLIVTLDESR